MNYFKHMIETLQHKPVIGIISGFSVGGFTTLGDFFTNQGVLTNISIIGAWLGFMIVILTGLIKIIELVKLVRKK